MTKKARRRGRYQMHASLTLAPSQLYNVIDLSEAKLRSLAEDHPDQEIRKMAAGLLHDYLLGIIAVAWEGPVPVYEIVER